MSQTLNDIAKMLKASNKKVQLIYAFNGTGKTRLSREFKKLVSPKELNAPENGESGQPDSPPVKILYYSAFTEDLFYWDNDLEGDAAPRLRIQPNSFTDWIFEDQGQDQNIVAHFQAYTNQKLTPKFNEEYVKKGKDGEDEIVKAFSEVTFSYASGDENRLDHLKISKGEESNFIWSVFYALLDQVVSTLNIAEPESRDTRKYDHLKYVFIDDPVSSLDENHLIQLAVSLAELIKDCESDLRFVVTTHNPLFYNVLYNELNSKTCYLLEQLEDGTFAMTEKQGDSNKSFSYHLYLKQNIEQAITKNSIERFHFTLLRNLYEKTASFLGYPRWSELLPDDKQTYLNRVIQFTSHSTLSSEAVAEPNTQEKQTVKFLLEHLVKNYGYWQNAVEAPA